MELFGAGPGAHEVPDRRRVVVAKHDPVLGLGIFRSIDIGGVIEIGLLHHAKSPEPVAREYDGKWPWQGAQDLAHHGPRIPAMAPRRLHHRIDEDGVAIDLVRPQIILPVVGVAWNRAIELGGIHDGEASKLGMIRKIRRGMQACTVLHGEQGIRLIGAVDPGADQAVGVIDANAVVFVEHLVHALEKEAQGPTAFLGLSFGLARIE